MPSQSATAAMGFYGERITSHLEMPGRTVAEFRPGGRLGLAVTRLTCDKETRNRTAPVPTEAAFSILHQLHPLQRHSCWLSGHKRYSDCFSAGTVSVIDLRDSPQCEFGGRFDALQFYVPAEALEELAEHHAARRVDTLRWKRDEPDPITAALSESLLVASEFASANALLIDQLSLGLLTHFGETYGGMRRLTQARVGILASWQERRAKEMLHARFATDLSIAQIAEECGLTPSHFARAFRRNTGLAPHRYLMKLRVEEAKKLLVRPDLSLEEIAICCGFGGQSHLTRVFGRFTGVTPGVWRRQVGQG
ncbi:helix-turn-helix domain-containing protein [Bosea sp. RAF48]|uniref:helix-turn-helix domain-containing protein n=1 Tax=Bosea sp. RAF48 TaxID=3237480 RepID=UPI003F908787